MVFGERVGTLRRSASTERFGKAPLIKKTLAPVASFANDNRTCLRLIPMHATSTIKPVRSISDPEILRQVKELRRTDNWTNWYYLACEYLFVAVVIGGVIALYETFWTGPWSLVWLAPILVAANLCIGAVQHRLATYTHEAAHYMLFRNRLLNELVSEWCCMFPILGTTHPYRVQHIGHHQFPNDPEQDPDWTQLRLSGHRFQFPMTLWQFLWHCFFKQFLWSPNLLRYVLVRANFKVDQGTASYRMKRHASPLVKFQGIGFHVALVGVLAWCIWSDDLPLLLWLPVAMLTAMLAVLAMAPERWFAEYSVKCDFAPRWNGCMRTAFNALLWTGVANLTLTTGKPIWAYFFVLWMVPLGTSFAFFMILRQIVQHGNADRERFTNTRIFLVNRLIRLSVFPIGNDYHLPHHIFMMVPHYNLAKLHDLLMTTEPYNSQATVVTGYFFHSEQPPEYPTVIDLMTHEMTSAS
jgi:fatty acid desaturase